MYTNFQKLVFMFYYYSLINHLLILSHICVLSIFGLSWFLIYLVLGLAMITQYYVCIQRTTGSSPKASHSKLSYVMVSVPDVKVTDMFGIGLCPYFDVEVFYRFVSNALRYNLTNGVTFLWMWFFYIISVFCVVLLWDLFVMISILSQKRQSQKKNWSYI